MPWKLNYDSNWVHFCVVVYIRSFGWTRAMGRNRDCTSGEISGQLFRVSVFWAKICACTETSVVQCAICIWPWQVVSVFIEAVLDITNNPIKANPSTSNFPPHGIQSWVCTLKLGPIRYIAQNIRFWICLFIVLGFAHNIMFSIFLLMISIFKLISWYQVEIFWKQTKLILL